MSIPDKSTLHQLYKEHLNSGMFGALAFIGMDNAEVSADGWTVRTADGREFIDCLGGYGSFNLGHRHPKVIEAVKRQLDEMPMSCRLALNPIQAQLAGDLAEMTPGNLQYSFFSNSGTEAIEASLKLARLATGRPGIISATDGFHGKTLGSLSSTHRKHFQQPFEPLMSHFSSVPFGDVGALESAITDGTAAVLLEPVQGEGGIHVAPEGYLQAVRELTSARGCLLILDEVQTGIGRTGYNFACERDNVTPDILVLAKSLGGGVMPIGATVGTAAVWQMWNDNPTVHTSTFGGNQVACAAARATLKVLVEEELALKARTTGEYFIGKLRGLADEYPAIIKDVRGAGLMIGIEMIHPDVTQLFIASILEQGVLLAYTLNRQGVLRIEPPLAIPVDVVDEVIRRMGTALDHTKQIMEQFGLNGSTLGVTQ